MKRVAVVTGASSGIGKAIAQYYKNEDFRVVNVAKTMHPDFENLKCDLSFYDQKEAAVKLIQSEFPDGIDVLVNNAGVMFLDDLRDNTQTNLTLWTDLMAPIYLCTELTISIKTFGHIINIASVSGIIGDTDAPMYSACKAGIINFTRSMAKQLAPNIRVNCISPGFFDTNLVPGPTPKHLIDQVPMLREAQPHEIIPVVDMLQKSPYITGANIVIDGGLSL